MTAVDFEHITTDAAVAIYQATTPIFEGLFREIKELSRKKPEASMSTAKIKLVNRVLADLLVILKDEPTGKYLEGLDEDAVPQVSDAVLAMALFETGLAAFRSKYYKWFQDHEKYHWITKEFVANWNG
jgi:hypothetical protein